MAHRFEDLDVFQRAYKLSLEIHKMSLTMPQIEQRGARGSSPQSQQIDLRKFG